MQEVTQLVQDTTRQNSDNFPWEATPPAAYSMANNP